MSRTAAWALAIAAGAALSTPALAQPRRDGRAEPPGHRDAEAMRAQLAGLQPAGADANNAPNNGANADSGTAQAPLPLQGTEMISFSSFTEPIELTTLIDFVAEELGINVAIIDQPTGSIVFNAPMSFERERLLPLLDAMLEQYGYTITYDGLTQIYAVRTAAQVRPGFVGELATTKIIHTPNVTPSLLQNAIVAAMGGTAPSSIAYVDELGVIVITATARDVQRVEEVVRQILAYRDQLKLHRIELQHIAAPSAKERAIELVGGSSASNRTGVVNRAVVGRDPNNPNAVTTGLSGGTFDNLGDRLTIDKQGNALLFRGTADELESVLEIVSIIDVPTELTPKGYFAGSSARQIADIASQRGLGQVITLEKTDSNTRLFNQAQQQFQQFQDTSDVGGPVMVVDVARGSIIYYGTQAQQQQLADLLKEIGAEDERVVVRTYRLRHSQAENVADLLDAMISGKGLGSDSSLLPDNSSVIRNVQPVITASGDLQLFGPGGDEVSGSFDPDKVFVVPDELNNQVVVRAPLGQQEELGKLIERLDLRRPQVYIEAMIISVTDTRDFRLAVETQILNGQYGFQSNFGLSTASGASSTAAGDFQAQRSVLASLTGGTLALIQSESIPFIINAVRTNTDAKIISQPAILVNNNEEATLASVDEQPTTSQSQGADTTVTSFNGFEEAGTTLTVTPTISEGGFLRLQYEVELSSFVGAGSNGIPSPKQTNNISSAVTVPSDATIVVGGITVNNRRETVERIPLLGDIPLLGHLFRDTSQISTNSVLYIFLTPRIMTDPNFYDLKLFTQGPQSEVDVDQGVPELEPVVITNSRTTNAWTPPPPDPTAREGAFAAPTRETPAPANQPPAPDASTNDDAETLDLTIEPLDNTGG